MASQPQKPLYKCKTGRSTPGHMVSQHASRMLLVLGKGWGGVSEGQRVLGLVCGSRSGLAPTAVEFGPLVSFRMVCFASGIWTTSPPYYNSN